MEALVEKVSYLLHAICLGELKPSLSVHLGVHPFCLLSLTDRTLHDEFDNVVSVWAQEGLTHT
ncbi:hypothetical protein PG990_004307 [Apiospora arundinis]